MDSFTNLFLDIKNNFVVYAYFLSHYRSIMVY